MSKHAPEPFWNLPNALTLSRLGLAALIWLDPTAPFFVLALMVIAGLTDVADGWAARRLRARRKAAGEPLGRVGGPYSTGAWLDPICDKTFVLSVLGALYAGLHTPLWMLALIATREILLLPPFIASELIPTVKKRVHHEFTAARIGKVATVIQFATVLAILLRQPFAPHLAVVTGVVGGAAGVFYLWRTAKLTLDDYHAHHPSAH